MTTDQFKKKMIAMYGNEGEQWLNSLPQLVQKYDQYIGQYFAN